MKIIYYVHSTSIDNINHVCSGWNDVELSDKGINQAKNLSSLTSYKFDILFTSDLKRASDTAKLAWPNIRVIEDVGLRECDYGDFDGLSKDLIKYEEHINNSFPNGESLKDVEYRIREFIEYVKERYRGKIVGIIAHRATQLALEVILNNKTWEDAIKEDWRNLGNWQPGWEYEIKEDVWYE